MTKPLSRREFIMKSSLFAGITYPAMMAMGMLKSAPVHAFDLPGSGDGKHIVILGAGLAGMASAYELSKLGYRCTILESRKRTGGRLWSVKKGDTTKEVDHEEQVCKFDDGMYFNAGPSRIPHHHQLTLHYCRELGVPVEIYNNVNEGAYYFSEGTGPLSNKKIRIREVHNDMRGYMCELLAKAIDQNKVDTTMTREDAQKVIEYLRAEGGLDIDKLYKASSRRGYIDPPGAGETSGKIDDPYKLADMISSGLLDSDFYNVAEYTYELQMTMFQAVGGNQNISKAFEKKLGNIIKLGAEVKTIRNTEQGVRITYSDSGTEKIIEGDLCICTIPLPVLSNINHNFSSNVSRAIDFIPYMQTGKIGLQFKRRFWEEDENLFGGITHTNNELTQIFYPSNDYLGKKGVLIGYYNFNETAAKVGSFSNSDRQKIALEKGSLVHPQYTKEFENSFSVSWHLTPFSMGGWAVYNSDARKNLYSALLKPDKNVYFGGEHVTYLTAWMAGALESARKTVADIHARVTEQRVTYPTNKN
ncbi:MAG TPA: flavin monoamine oxidase family protein [Cyclobacteriaceae bacterium]|nr:flavin monoamine oxidase family protein [Cyclobacteriaceae bacterium]